MRFQHDVGVRREDRHPVARLKAESRQHPRLAQAAVRELLVGQAQRSVDDRDPVREHHR